MFGGLSDIVILFVKGRASGGGRTSKSVLFDSLQNTISDAGILASAFNQLIGVEKNSANFANAKGLLAQQNQFIASSVESTGRSSAEITGFLQRGQRQVISDIADFQEKEFASRGIVI